MPSRNNRLNRLNTGLAGIVVAVATLGAPGAGFARGGEALEIELPSMRTPVTPSVVASSPEEVALASNNAHASASFGSGLTREQVREQLKQARANGTLSMQGEAGDTPQVLAAREAFNTAQRENIMAAYASEQQRTMALVEAELRRTAIEAEGQTAQTLASSDGETLLSAGDSAIERDSSEIRIDVIDLQSSAVSPSESELVIVSVDGGDAAEMHAQAMHVRRQLGAMGLSQSRIYVESPDAESNGPAVAAAPGDMDVAAFAEGESDVAMAADNEDQ